MMIKANGEYLDFNGDIEIESRIKLFEDIAKSKGDFSYDIQIQDNGSNRKILGIPRADTVKIIYQTIPSEIVNDSGEQIHQGKLQVNKISGGFISSTFYAGNAEWFELLSDPISDLPLFKYDQDLTKPNIQASWDEDSGIVFPLIDSGTLVTRKFYNVMIEDFVGFFYVKTLLHEVFANKGIKINGDLLKDSFFKTLAITSNRRSEEEVQKRSSYVNKSTPQTAITTLVKVTFDDETTDPFFDGSTGNFTNSTYTADVDLIVEYKFSVLVTNISNNGRVYVYKNGVEYKRYSFSVAVFQPDKNISDTLIIKLYAGDTLDIWTEWTPNFVADYDIDSGSTVKITPIFIYRSFGNAVVPNWTQGEFVSNIFRIFNVLPSYNATSKTLTLDLFNNIKNKEYVDISNEIVVNEVDFSEFVSSYAKNNYFKYQESEDEDLREYNISNFISYGSGNLTLDNDYIDNSADIVESDFTSPITYLNPVFNMSMERINYLDLQETLERNITSVSDASGVARFNIANADDYFAFLDLVRLDTNVDDYNGDWVVASVTTTYITLTGVDFSSSASGTVKLMRHNLTTDDNVYIFSVVKKSPVSDFSKLSTFYWYDRSLEINEMQIAYFNILNNDTKINNVLKQSLSFGEVNNPLSYQVTLLDTYWPLFSRILNDPVMLLSSGYLKKTTFDKVKTFLRPVRIQTEETSNLYYVNRNRGYKDSARPCELELIKLN